ncbi:MAG: hypothetical protein QM758_25320 [Armatimonas sp.]
MKTLLSLLTIVTLVSAVCAAPSPRRQFQAEHNRQVSAFNHKDLNGFMAHYAPALQVHQRDGKTLDLAGWRGFIGSVMPCILKVRTHQHHVTALTAVGDEWKARIAEREDYSIKDNLSLFGKKGAHHQLRVNSIYEEIWTKTPQGWRVRDLKFLSEKQVLDGKPIP